VTVAATPSGPGPDLPDEGDDHADLRDLFEAEPVPASDDEAADFFSAFAATPRTDPYSSHVRPDSP
jgi:hypothetical protein